MWEGGILSPFVRLAVSQGKWYSSSVGISTMISVIVIVDEISAKGQLFAQEESKIFKKKIDEGNLARTNTFDYPMAAADVTEIQ